MAAELKVNVRSGPVNLFLTLSPTLLEKCLDRAVLVPFIKAYNKRQSAEESVDTLLSVTLSGSPKDGEVSRATASDETITTASLLGSGEAVMLVLNFPFREVPVEQTPGWETMSEVEKLKVRRRAEMAAKRAAAGSEAADISDSSMAAPTTAAPATPAAPVEAGALGKIAQAEAKVEALMTEISAVEDLLGAAKDTQSLDAAAKRQAAVGAAVGSVTAMMDEIDIGEIEDDEARAAARARRKALNKRCALASSGDVEVDGDLAAKSLELKKAVMAARAAMN